MMRTTPRPCSFVLFLLVTSLACSVFAGKPQNVFMQKHDGTVIKATAIWQPASKAYLVKVGAVQQTIPARDIAAVKPIVFPPELRQIMQAIDSGSSASPFIAKLEAISRDWDMMGADLDAIPYLARGYLQANQTDKAIRKFEELFRKNPMTKKKLAIQSIYWSALLKKGDTKKLQRGLEVGIREGSRPTQATALVMRGDLLGSDKTKTREALIDGYLRVILFYQDEKAAYEEALFKAAKAHTVLNEHHYAEKWRVKLRSQFPNGKWTKKLTS